MKGILPGLDWLKGSSLEARLDDMKEMPSSTREYFKGGALEKPSCCLMLVGKKLT
jgi:hypothetical protein